MLLTVVLSGIIGDLSLTPHSALLTPSVWYRGRWPLGLETAYAEVPVVCNYQGQLADNTGVPVMGSVTMTFRLYDAATAGNKVWEESHTVSLAEADKGLFNVILGSVTSMSSVDMNIPLWLSVQVSGDSEMTPRQRMTPVGQALNADKLDGLDSASFMRTDVNTATSGKLTITRSGTALVITPTTDPSADTKMLDVQSAAGSTEFSVDSEGDVSVAGNLAVTGTISGSTSTSGTTNLTWTVDNDNTSGTEPADGAGLVIEGGSGDASMLWDATNDQVDLNRSLQLTSTNDLVLGTGTFDNTSSSADAYVTGNLEVDGTIYGTVSGGSAVTGTTNASFNVGSDDDATAVDISLLFGQTTGQESLVFDGDSTDDFLLSDDLNLQNSTLLNIGNAGTDFDTSGGLTLAAALTANGGVSLGTTTLSGTSAVIDFSEFDVSGTTGAITINDGGDAGSVSVEGTVLDVNSLDFTAAGTLTTVGDATVDATTDIILDADGADVLLKDGGTTFATFTNSSTDLTVDLAGGQLLLADTDVLNLGGVSALAYHALANSGGAAGGANVTADNDLYIQGDLEVDGTLYADGTIQAGDLSCTDCLDFTDLEDTLDVDAATDINLGANDLYVDLTTSGVFSIRDVATAYWTFDDDSTVDVVFPAAGLLTIDAATTDTTTTDGVVDLDVDSATNAAKAVDLNLEALLTNTTGTQTVTGLNLVPVQGSTGVGGTHELYGLYVQNLATSGTPTGTNTEYGLRVGTGYDYAAYLESPVSLLLPAAGSLVLDAATTDSTGTAGALDVNLDTTASQAGIDVDAESITDAGVDTISGIKITATATSTDADNLYGLQVANLAGTATAGNEYALYQAGTSWDYGLYVEDAALLNSTLAVTGDTTLTGDLAVNGDDLTSDGDLTINPAGGNVLLASGDVLNAGGAAAAAYNFFASSTATASANMDAATDLYVQSDLEVDGTIYGTVSGAGGDVTDVGNCDGPACFTGTEGTTLTSTTSEVLDLGTADTLIYRTNTDGNRVTFRGDDGVTAANTIYDTTGAGAITVGSADVTSLTVTTDGTGTGEVVLPNEAIGAAEVVTDSLDFAQFEDTLDVDAATDINLGANLLSIDLDSTGDFAIRDGTTNVVLFEDDSTIDVTFPAAGLLTLDAATTANTTTAGVLDLNVTSATTNSVAQDIATTHTATGATTSYSLKNAWSSSAVVAGASVSQTAYGDYVTATKTGADTATGTYSLYGTYSTASNTGRTDAGTVTTYGGYFDATGDTAGTASAYGLYIADVSGADTNVGLCFDCDGTWTSSTVASGIQFGTDANAVTLYRSASDTLRTGDSLTVDLDLTVTGNDLVFGNGESFDNNTDGSLDANLASTGNLNVLVGNLAVGNGTPGVSLNGEDAYIEGTLEVDGAAQFDGAITANTDVDLVLAGAENLTVGNTTLNSAADTVAVSHTLTGDVSADGLSIALTNNNASATTGTNYALNVVNADNSTNTSVIDALAVFSNAQATETLADGVIIRHDVGSGTLTDGLQIENTTTGGTITNAINIVETAGAITTGINLGAGLSTGIDANSNTIINIGNTSTDFTSVGGLLLADDLRVGGNDITNSSGTLTINSVSNVRIGDTATPGTATGDDDLFVESDLEVDGIMYADGQIISASQAASTTAGALWQDSTQKAMSTYVDGIQQALTGTIFTSTASATVANTTTETSIIGTGVGTTTLPANFFVAGKAISVRVSGVYGTTTSAPTLQIRVKLGSTVILDTGAQTTNASLSNRGFWVEGEITCRTTGASGTVFGQGIFNRSRSATAMEQWDMENSATVTIDTTASQTLDVMATWGTANASNTITGTNAVIEILN